MRLEIALEHFSLGRGRVGRDEVVVVESDAVRADIGQVMDDVDGSSGSRTSTRRVASGVADVQRPKVKRSSAGFIGARCHGDVTFVGTVSGQ